MIVGVREVTADLVSLESSVIVTIPDAHADCEIERIALLDEDMHIEGVELSHIIALPEIVTVDEREDKADALIDE